MCILNEIQIQRIYLRCNCIPLKRLVELCMNPASGITVEGLQKAGYHKIDQLTELCYHQEETERIQSENIFSVVLEKKWNSIIQMPDNEEKIECINKFIERLYQHDIILARKYRKMAECLVEELRECVHPIFGIIDTMGFEWTKAVESNTIQSYIGFVERYPDSKFQEEAKRRIQCMEKLLQDMKKVPSDYSRERMFDIISNNRLSREDLVYNYSILTDKAYGHIRRYPHLEDEQRELPISHIEKPYSEPGNVDVYFLGVSGSGKTCLLAGLMSLSGQLDFQFDPMGLGGGGLYAVELRNYARSSMLPPRTDQTFIQVIDAQLGNENRNPLKISFIEMSGVKIAEFAIMDNPNNLENLGPGATGLLTNENKKVFFFVIDPTNEKNIRTSDGKSISIKQSDVVDKVINLLSEHRSIMNKIDSMHIIVTKSDTLGEYVDADIITERLSSQGYSTTLSHIRIICETYDINKATGFHVGIYPFCLGKFMPGDVYCFDETDSLKILHLSPIQPCVYGPPLPNSLFRRLSKWFNS